MSSSSNRKQQLLDSMKRQRIQGRLHHPQGLDEAVFATSGLVAVAFVAWGFASPTTLGGVAAGALNWVMTSTGWLFVTATTVFTVFTVYIVWIALSRFGGIPWAATRSDHSSALPPGWP